MTRAALVVGINTYTHLKPLTAPSMDAETIAQCLQQDGEFRVTRLPETIAQESGQNIPTVAKTLLVNQAQLEQKLEQLFCPDSNQLPETALFYFSGHGIADTKGFDKGYLATSDTDPNYPRQSISLRWLHWLLSASPIRNQIIWLDCCHSGGLLVDVDAANPGHGENRNRCFIASSRDFEQSWQDLNSPYSVLTKALLDGLDPTRLPDRWVDSFALVDYVNQALRGELQSPICTNFGIDAINLTRTWREDTFKSEAVTDTGVCPYKGLEFFDCNDDDPQYFFGREALTGRLLGHVRTQKFLALVGASGNGKSSVLRAGLLHQLKLGRRIAGSEQWQILTIRPDDQPMKNLARAFMPEEGSQLERAEALGRATGLLDEGAPGLVRLIDASPALRVVLVIDQFEEIFTRCPTLAEREQFFACLMGALEEIGDKLRLIIAMRADFVGKCLEREYSGLAQHVQRAMIPVLPMTEAELQDAICKPAERVEITVEDALVNEILNDIVGAPGSLPLLQYTLKELWQRCQENQLTLSTYLKLGRIQGTLDSRATQIYNRFEPAEQDTVQHIFQQLTQLGDGTEDTRRRVFLDNLIAEPKHPRERVLRVVEALSNQENRLLVTSEMVSKENAQARRAIVDVAHEALIRHWRLLRQWVEQNRDLLRQQRRIEASAVTWQNHQQAKGYLLEGFPLKEALQFQKHQGDVLPLSDIARTYLKKSIWQRRWNRLKLASLLVLLVPIVDYSLHRQKVEQHYAKLNGADKAAERESALFLTQHCPQLGGQRTGYFTERMTGNYCRSLALRTFNPGADLSGADLRDAVLRDAVLRDAVLRDADLRDAVLSDAVLFSADLRFADLRFADLRFADLRDADLRDAVLHDAVLSGAFLSSAVLSSADLRGAFLNSAVLSSADLRSADLRDAVLRGAVLSSAVLHDANLHDAVLSNAVLAATDLRNVRDLTPGQMSGENQPFLCNVVLPAGITDIDPNRDCNILPQVLMDRYRWTQEEAEQEVQRIREYQWDEPAP